MHIFQSKQKPDVSHNITINIYTIMLFECMTVMIQSQSVAGKNFYMDIKLDDCLQVTCVKLSMQ